VALLNGLLADAAGFWYKLRNYHWNVTGPNFFVLHDQFEKLYNEWDETLDTIAERIKQLGGQPVPNLHGVLELASVKEEDQIIDAKTMIERTLEDIHAQRERMKSVQQEAIDGGDKSTENMIDDFIDASAMHVWMLGAYLKEKVEEN